MHQNEHFFFDFFCVVEHEKSCFLKMLKTHQFLNVFALLKKYDEKSVRGGYFLPHIMKVAFSALLLSWPALWLRLGVVLLLDTFQALVCVALCRRLLFKMCISSRQNAWFYVSLCIQNVIFLSKMCSFEARTGVKPCFFTQMLNSAFLPVSFFSTNQRYAFLSKSSKCVFRRGETLVFFFVSRLKIS